MENNKPVFYMLVGLPASGKSSESDRLGDVIVRSSDYLRDKLCGDINDMKIMVLCLPSYRVWLGRIYIMVRM